jgi:predicted ATPase
MRDSLPDLPAPAVLPPEEERRRVFEAFAQSLRALMDRPLVLFIDDLHWADRTTLDWLGYLLDRLHDQPLLLVLTYRPEDAPAPLIHLITNWNRQNVLRRVTLPRLDPEESAALVRSLGGDPALAENVQAQSAGNPYFLIELATGSDLAPALTELIRARLMVAQWL